jgi:hypothetical protein
MGVIPTDYNKFHGKNDARFSFFECFENKEVFNALISAVETWAKSKNCTEIIGPMAFSDKEPQGFLTKGFEEKAMLVTNHSFPFMVDFIKENHYEEFVDLVQYDVPITAQILNRYKNFNERVSKNLKIKTVEFTSTKSVKPYVKPVFDLINKTYTEIYGFTKLTEDEMTEFAERFLPLLNPKLIKMITDENGELLAFVIAMADLSEAIKNSRKNFTFWLGKNFMGNENFKKASTFVGSDSSKLSKQRFRCGFSDNAFRFCIEIRIQNGGFSSHYERQPENAWRN